MSTVLGTLGAIGMHAMKKGWASLLVNLSYLPMTTPDIVTGVSLMLMFVFMKIPLGKGTMLMAHIAFDTPYVLFAVMPRLKQMNPNLYEAALDLGCHPLKALYKVILPEIHARRGDRRAAGVHDVAGRLRHLVLHLQHRPEPVDGRLLRRAARRGADDVRAFDADVPGHTGCCC